MVVLASLEGRLPELWNKLQAATPEVRRRAALVACQWAVQVTLLEEVSVNIVLKRLAAGEEITEAERDEVRQTASSLDSKSMYSLDEDVKERLMNRSWAAWAVLAAAEDTEKSAAEAIYYAWTVKEDAGEMVQLVQASLEQA